MADTPEDCSRWINAFKMVLRALSLKSPRQAQPQTLPSSADSDSSASVIDPGPSALDRFLPLLSLHWGRSSTQGRVVHGLPRSSMPSTATGKDACHILNLKAISGLTCTADIIKGLCLT